MASSPNLLQKIRRRIAKTSSCTYNILDSDACNGMDVYMRKCNVNATENPYSMQESVTRDLFNGNIKFEDFPYHFRFIKDEGLGHFTFDPDLIAPEEPTNKYGEEKNGNRIEVPVTVETTPKKHVSPPRLKRLDPTKKGNTIPRRKNLKPGTSNGTMCDVNNGNKIIDTVINCRNSTSTLDKKRLPPTPPEEGGQVLTFSTFKGDPVKDMGPPPPQLPPRNKNKEGTLDVMSRSYPGPNINDNDPILQKNSLTVDNEYVRVGDGRPLPKVSPPLLKPLRNRTASDSSTSDKNRSSRSMSESSSDQNVKMRSISESSSDQNVKLRSSSESSTELLKTSVLESPEENVFHINPVPEIQNDHLFRDNDLDDFPPPPPPILVESVHNQNISLAVIGETVSSQEDYSYPPPPDFLTDNMEKSSFPGGPVMCSGPKVSDSRDTVSSLLQSPEEGSTSGVTDLGSPDRLPNNSDYKIEEISEVPMTGQVYAGVNRNEEGGQAPSDGKQDMGAAGGLEDDDDDYDINAEDGGFFEDVRDDITKNEATQEEGDTPREVRVHRPPPLPDRNYRAEAYAKSNNSSSEEQDDHDYSAYHSSGYAGVDLQDVEPIHMTMEEVWQEARSKGIPLAKPQALASPNKRTKHKDEEKHKRRSFFKEKFKMPNFFRSKSEPDGRKSPRIHKKTLSDVSANQSPMHNLSPMHPHMGSSTMGKPNKRCSSSSMGSSTSFGDHQGRCGACKDQSETGSQHTSSAGSWMGHGDTDDTDGSIQSNADFIESLRKLKDCGWYWGPMNWDDAEQKLSNKPDGSFLVRDSSDDRYILSLSFRSQGTTHHTRIEHYKGMFSFYSQPKSHGAATIIEFIQKAMEHSRSGKFLYFLRPRAPGLPPAPVQLLFPVSRFRLLQSMQHMCRFVILKHVRYDHIDQLPLPEKLKAYLKESQYYTEYILDEGNGEFSEL